MLCQQQTWKRTVAMESSLEVESLETSYASSSAQPAVTGGRKPGGGAAERHRFSGREEEGSPTDRVEKLLKRSKVP